MSDADQSTVPSTITGIIAGTITLTTGYFLTQYGEAAVHNQLAGGATASTLLLTGLTVAAIIIAAIIMIWGALFIVEPFAAPRINGRTEYTITGFAGTLGVLFAALTSMTLAVTGATPGLLPGNTSTSVLATAVIAIPLAATYYDFYTPDAAINTAPRTTDNQDERLDPEVVREKTEVWSEEPQRTHGSPPDPPDQHETNSQQNTANTASQQSTIDTTEFEFNWQEDTGTSFADVGGMEDLKAELRGEVIKPIEEKERAAELGITAPNIIFYGPPGTGKTYTAQALATELDLPFASLSGADLQSKWINESATKVNELFTEAKTIAAHEGGAVVFLDELDTVLKSRDDSSNSHEEDTKVVNEFLNHLEDTKDHDIVFIGATNRLEALDDAGIRSGRIDKKIEVGKPDAGAREAVLRQQLNERNHEVTAADISRIAEATDGLVAADLELLVKNAATRVFTRDEETIRAKDLDAALDSVK